LIHAKDELPFDVHRKFWEWMAKNVEEGVLVAPRQVFKEVAENEDHQDELAKWVMTRRERGLCIPPTKRVTERIGEIAKFVLDRYKEEEALDFLKGADAWVIAQAMEDSGIVVTQESTEHPKARKARIPDICKHFGVQCINRVAMLRTLKADA
jgi:hypothetical protein